MAADTSATVADAAEALTGIRAHIDGDVRGLAGTGLAGPAVTMRLVRDDAASAAAAGLAAIRLIESAPRGSVLVMSVESEKTWAAMGASFAQLARARGLAGFTVDGAVAVAPRDRANDVLRRAEELRLEESRLLTRIRRFGSYTAAVR